MSERLRLISTASTIAELEDVLNRPQIVRYHKQTPEEIARILDTLATVSEIVVAQVEENRASRDPDDDVFLATAVAGKADYIVSGDSHLRELEIYDGIPILAPNEFVEVVLVEC